MSLKYEPALEPLHIPVEFVLSLSFRSLSRLSHSDRIEWQTVSTEIAQVCVAPAL